MMANGHVLLSLVLVGALLAGCGGGDDAGEADATVRSTTVELILRDPDSWDQGETVTVRGRAYPREGGFLLVDSGSSIWVAAPSGVRNDIERGNRVTIRGEIMKLTADDADEVIEALRGPVEPGLPPPESDAVAQTPAEVGEPFIVFRALVSGGDGDGGAATRTQTTADSGEATGIYELADVRRRLEAAGLMLVRTGGGAGLAEEIDEPLLAAGRYEISPSSREFELLIFPSRAIMQKALDDLKAPDALLDERYDFETAANVIAAFPPPTENFRGYETIRRVLSELDES